MLGIDHDYENDTVNCKIIMTEFTFFMRNKYNIPFLILQSRLFYMVFMRYSMLKSSVFIGCIERKSHTKFCFILYAFC